VIKLGGTHFNFWRFTIQKSSIDHSWKLLNHSFILHISCLKCNILAIGISTISTQINKPSNYTSHFLHLSGCKLAIKMTKVTWSGLLIWQTQACYFLNPFKCYFCAAVTDLFLWCLRCICNYMYHSTQTF